MSPLFVLAIVFEIGIDVYGFARSTPPPAWAEKLFDASFACLFPSLFACVAGSIWWARLRAGAVRGATTLASERVRGTIGPGDRVGLFTAEIPDDERLILRRVSMPWAGRLAANGALLAATVFFAMEILGKQLSVWTIVFSPLLFAPIAAVAVLANWSDTWTIRLDGTSIHVQRRTIAVVPFRRTSVRFEAPLSAVLVPRGMILHDRHSRVNINGFDDHGLGKVQARRLSRWLDERGALEDGSDEGLMSGEWSDERAPAQAGEI